jgi:hypothetical protein
MFITHKSICGGSNQVFARGGVDGHEDVGERESDRSSRRFRNRDECIKKSSIVYSKATAVREIIYAVVFD